MALDKLSGNSFATGAIANSLGYTPANKAGDMFTGAVTISNTISVGNTTITGSANFIGGGGTETMRIKQTYFGYSSSYTVLQLGRQLSGQTVSLFVDPSTINSGSFNGNGKELLVPQDFTMIAPTSSNTTFKNVMIFDDGRVRIPNQPAWQLRPNGGTNSTLGSGPYAVGWSDSGGGYTAFYRGVTLSGSTGSSIHNANSTGRLNIQTTGAYKIWATIRLENAPRTGNIFVYVNGTEYMRQHVESWGYNNYKHGFISAVIQLSAGDYIEIKMTVDGGVVSGYNDTVNWFSGHLIG